MATFSEAIAVADITALKAVTATNGMIRKVTTLDASYGYPDSYFIFRTGATYTERLPGIVADNAASGRWVMFPTPLVLNAGDPGGTADLPGILWVNTTSGVRYISNPDLSWSAIANGSSSAVTTTTTSYTQPAIGANVTINVDDSSIFAVGQYVFVEGGGNYEVISKPTLTQLEIRNTGDPGNVAPATVITSGKLVTPSGQSLGGLSDPTTTRGDLIYRNPSSAIDRLGAGTAGQVLTSDGTDISWQDPTGGFADPMTTAGDIIIRNGGNTTTRLGIGSEGQVLTVSSGIPAWAAGGFSNPVGTIYQSVQTVTYNDAGTSTMDNGTHNIFSLTANGTSTTLAHSNVPTTGNRYGFELHLTWTSGAITWPTSWTKGMNAPATTGNYIIQGVTVDGGTSFTIQVIYQ